MTTCKIIFRALIVIGTLWTAANAGAAEWTIGGGPFGGDRGRVLFDPNEPDILYTDSYDFGGIYVSRDGGETWTQSKINYGQSVVDVTDNNGVTRIFAGVAGIDAEGFFMSDDHGETWTRIFNEPAVDVKVDPWRPERVICFLQKETAKFSKIYFSEDYGAHWRRMVPPIAFTYNRAVSQNDDFAYDPADPDTVYLGLNLFAACFNDSACIKKETAVFAWNMETNALERIYQTGQDEKISMLYKVSVQEQATIFAAFQDRADAGFVRSSDGGETWLDIPLQTTTMVQVNPAFPNEVYAGTYGGGIYRSESYGAFGSWLEFNEGLDEISQEDDFFFSFSPDGKVGFASTLGGVATRVLH